MPPKGSAVATPKKGGTIPVLTPEAVAAEAAKLVANNAAQSGRMKTMHQSRTEHNRIVKVAAGTAANLLQVSDEQTRMKDENTARGHRNALHNHQLTQSVADARQENRDNQLEVHTLKEDLLEAEGQKLKEKFTKWTDKKVKEITKLVQDFYDGAVECSEDYDKKFEGLHEKVRQVKMEKKKKQQARARRSPAEELQARIQKDTKRRMKEQYTAERAAMEFSLMIGDPFHIPDFPLGHYRWWPNAAAWYPHLRKFLDVLKHQLGSVDEWPEFTRPEENYGWTKLDGMRKPMQERLKPVFEEHFLTILELSGQKEEEMVPFYGAIEKGSTRFLYHYNEEDGIPADSYLPATYAGIMTLLRILKEMREGPPFLDEEETISDTSDDDEPNNVRWTKEMLLDHAFGRLANELKAVTEKNEGIVTDGAVRRFPSEWGMHPGKNNAGYGAEGPVAGGSTVRHEEDSEWESDETPSAVPRTKKRGGGFATSIGRTIARTDDSFLDSQSTGKYEPTSDAGPRGAQPVETHEPPSCGTGLGRPTRAAKNVLKYPQ